MKVHFFIHSLSPGGAERVTVDLANYWSEKGWEVTIVTIAPKIKDFYKLHPSVRRISLDLERESHYVISGIANNLKRTVIFRKILKNEHPDVAIGMMTTSSVLLGLAGIGTKKVILIGSEHVYPPMSRVGLIWNLLRRLVFSSLDSIVTQTTESAQWIRNNTYARRVEVIPNPIVYPLSPHPPFLDPKDFLAPGQKMLLGIGRLTEQKGFDLLIEAFARISAKFPHWVLVILGEGPLYSNLVNQVKLYGLQDKVFMPGVAGNIGDWYRAADIYVMSSRFEGFGNTLAEALAYGVPAISFDCPTGPSDIIRHGIDGLLVPNGNVNSLADALSQLMGDEGMRLRFAQNAIEARERFSIGKVASLWERLFEDLGLRSVT